MTQALILKRPGIWNIFSVLKRIWLTQSLEYESPAPVVVLLSSNYIYTIHNPKFKGKYEFGLQFTYFGRLWETTNTWNF